MKTKKTKASVLVMSLLIMFAIVVIALSVTLVSVRERKISIGSGKSSRAFQTAQTGVEKTMQAIEDLRVGTHFVNEIEDKLGADASCNDGLLIQDSYTVELKKSDNSQINCNDSSTEISEIASIKSVGKEGDTEQRAIEAAVAAGSGGITGGCSVLGTPGVVGNIWGSGCDSAATTNDCIGASASGYDCGASYSNGGSIDYCVCVE